MVRKPFPRFSSRKLNLCSIGLPPAGKHHIDVDPAQIAAKNQGIIGTIVSPLRDIDETLDFARRGEQYLAPPSLRLHFLTFRQVY